MGIFIVTLDCTILPQFAEWGYNNLDRLKDQYGENKIWKVPEKNWPNINTYEDGLLVKKGE